MVGDQSKIMAAVLGFIENYPLATDSLVSHQMYETKAVTMMRGVFARLLERPQVYLVYAPPGSGKTDIARHLISEHNRQHGAEQTTQHIDGPGDPQLALGFSRQAGGDLSG